MNKSKTIPKVGKFYHEDTLPQKNGSIVTRDLFYTLSEQIGRHSRKYFDYMNELPFVAREKQLRSVVDISLAKIVDVFSCEALVGRKHNGPNKKVEDGHGWVDCWSIYRDYAFLIELKHRYMSIRSGKVRNSLSEEWVNAKQQIRTISKEDMSYYSRSTKGLVRCALLIVPHYVTVTAHEQPDSNVKENHSKLINDLKPNWSTLWSTHPDMTIDHKYNDDGKDRFEKYFAVSFCGDIIL